MFARISLRQKNFRNTCWPSNHYVRIRCKGCFENLKETSFLSYGEIMKNLNISPKKFCTLVASTFLALSISFFSTSCGDGSSTLNLKIPGVNGPTVTLSEDNVLISMVFSNISIEGGLRYNIPKYNQSYLEISPDFESGGTLMAISVSLQDIFYNSGLQRLDAQRLPGGRALPGVATGELPAVAFKITKFDYLSFYIGPKVFGVFVALDLPFDNLITTTKFYSGSKRLGNLSIVGKDENKANSGLLLLLNISNSKDEKQLKKIAKEYK